MGTPVLTSNQRSGFRPTSSTALDRSQFHSYCESVKNITISVDDLTYRRARLAAARREKSVSALVRDLINDLPTEESEDERFERLKCDEIELRKQIKEFDGGDRLSRDELYDRARFR